MRLSGGKAILGILALAALMPFPAAAILQRSDVPLEARAPDATVLLEEYLADDLWDPRYDYDAGHMAMVPLHVAFLDDREGVQERFRDQFSRFVQNQSGFSATGQYRLAQLHYLYLASRFVALSYNAGEARAVPAGLPEMLRDEITDLGLRGRA